MIKNETHVTACKKTNAHVGKRARIQNRRAIDDIHRWSNNEFFLSFLWICLARGFFPFFPKFFFLYFFVFLFLILFLLVILLIELLRLIFCEIGSNRSRRPAGDLSIKCLLNEFSNGFFRFDLIWFGWFWTFKCWSHCGSGWRRKIVGFKSFAWMCSSDVWRFAMIFWIFFFWNKNFNVWLVFLVVNGWVFDGSRWQLVICELIRVSVIFRLFKISLANFPRKYTSQNSDSPQNCNRSARLDVCSLFSFFLGEIAWFINVFWKQKNEKMCYF